MAQLEPRQAAPQLLAAVGGVLVEAAAVVTTAALELAHRRADRNRGGVVRADAALHAQSLVALLLRENGLARPLHPHLVVHRHRSPPHSHPPRPPLAGHPVPSILSPFQPSSLCD